MQNRPNFPLMCTHLSHYVPFFPALDHRQELFQLFDQSDGVILVQTISPRFLLCHAVVTGATKSGITPKNNVEAPK